jgi:peptidoglycan/xylan/chitin deacetylase (PgdA/CDA1 family)
MTFLKALIKETVAHGLHATNLISRDKVGTIIYYHRVCDRKDDVLWLNDLVVTRDNFTKQIAFLKEAYNVLPLEIFIERLEKGKPLASRDIAITFDDGYADNYTFAYPILKKHNLPATIFVTTGYVGCNELFWWDKVSLFIKALKEKKVDNAYISSAIFFEELRHALEKATESKLGLTSFICYLKRIGSQRRKDIINHLEGQLQSLGVLRLYPRLFLSWSEIKEMSNNGISFGSHTHTHAILTEVSLETAREELIKSKEILERNIEKKVTAFAYPDGCLNNGVKSLVKEIGYRYAMQTTRHLDLYNGDIFAIPRRKIKEGHSVTYKGKFSTALFEMELSGISNVLFMRNLRKKNPYVDDNA